ncbi:hypothetical protein [Moraxella oblonga]|uniref:hypothetical protein n=1 Tax=Moraxella oblonga TaxID=200413 RepID=UPI00082DBAEA|nr:hypothetical protein [Moraxella oblonga]
MKIKHTLIALLATAIIGTQAHAAVEVDEADFGPTYATVAADVALVKPFQVVKAVTGTAIHLIGLPFSLASGSAESSANLLVRQPWEDLKRCVGCTGAYDDYINSQNMSPNETRFTVDGPAEIIIQGSQNVVVNPQ